MGYGTSLYSIYRVLSLSVWVLGTTTTGRFSRGAADRRARRFANDLIDRAEVDLRVEGGESLPPDRPFVYMSNHQSMFDIPVLWATLPASTLRFVGKTELFQTPIWGRAMRAGEMIEVDRSNREQAIASLGRGAELIRTGVSVWIAPEGHRSETGEVGPLKKGGFHLAKNAGVDIVPVALNGTISVLPPHQMKIHQRQPVRVVIGEPISVGDRDIASLVSELQRFFDRHVGDPVPSDG